MARKKFVYKDIEFDSQEEINFYYWLEEAKDLGIVEKWEYQPESFILSEPIKKLVEVKLKTKVKQVEKSLLQGHKYTADFKIWFTDSILNYDTKLKSIVILKKNIIFIDIKGGFNSFGSHSNFSVESKWVWEKYGILVEKVISDKWFKNTWVPENVRYTPKTGKLRTKYLNLNTFESITNGIIQNETNKIKTKRND